jgi:EAL domain-containing protein (putative c-di-GMP-specific phosphodiesterase class I)
MAVNLSARAAGDFELPGAVRRVLVEHGVRPQQLVLELTESAVLDDPERARHVLGDLHELGVKIAIDDFGTGYASLAYLTTLPVDSLKVDRSFVMDLVSGGTGAPIVQFTVDLGRSLGLTVVGGCRRRRHASRSPADRLRRGAGFLPDPPAPGRRSRRLVRHVPLPADVLGSAPPSRAAS